MTADLIDLTTLKSGLLRLMRNRWIKTREANKHCRTVTAALMHAVACDAILAITEELGKANRPADAIPDEPEPAA